MQRKHLEFYLRFILSKTLILNGDKFDWETMNTRKIKVIFNGKAGRSDRFSNDYGTRIQIKCHQKIDRISQTLDAEKCVNWEFMDSFGVRFQRRIISEDPYERVWKFYDSVNWRNIGLWLTMKSKDVMNTRPLKIWKGGHRCPAQGWKNSKISSSVLFCVLWSNFLMFCSVFWAKKYFCVLFCSAEDRTRTLLF